MPTLRRGDSSPWVGDVQRRLTALGYYKGPLDGGFGVGTQSAVSAYQSAMQLHVNGSLDEPTALALGLDHLAWSASQVTPESVALLFPGARFRDIRLNLPFVIAGLVASALTDRTMSLMALATIATESAKFLPVNEGISKFNTSLGGRPFDRYDSRKDLGNLGAPDGLQFRGRGYVQLTGRANYQDIGGRIGLGGQLVETPELANDPAIAGRILAEFLARSQAALRLALNGGDLARARKLVNGGTVGKAKFCSAYERGLEVFDEALRLT